MKIEVDALGLKCPEPIMLQKKLLKKKVYLKKVTEQFLIVMNMVARQYIIFIFTF